MLEIVLNEPLSLNHLHDGLHFVRQVRHFRLQFADDVRLHRLVDFAFGASHRAVGSGGFDKFSVFDSAVIDCLQMLDRRLGQALRFRLADCFPEPFPLVGGNRACHGADSQGNETKKQQVSGNCGGTKRTDHHSHLKSNGLSRFWDVYLYRRRNMPIVPVVYQFFPNYWLSVGRDVSELVATFENH